MSKTDTTKKLPAYRIYSVAKNGEAEKSTWAEIGAAWKNKDGKGLSLQFTARPLEGAEIVLREPLPPLDEPKKGKRRYEELNQTLD